MYILLFGIFHNTADNLCTLVNTQDTGIETQIVVLGLTPGTAGIVLIVHTAALVLFVQTGLRALVGFAVAADNTLRTERNIGKGENMEGIFPIFQNVVRISSNNDTGTLISDLQDYTALNVPQEVSSGKTVHNAGNALGRKGIGEQTAGGRMLAVLFHEFGCEAGFQSDLVNQFFVIEGDAQLFGDHAADGTSAGTKLTADGDDFLFHTNASSRELNSLTVIIVKVLSDVN